jgi:GMP synthase (glutamine-hydrolysing)
MLDHNDSAQILVVQPDPKSPLDRFDGWLRESGLEFVIVRPFLGEVVPHTLLQDGLIVLGGEMSARADTEFAWLEDIRILLRDAVTRAQPTLGICLGGQLLAQAVGGQVTLGHRGIEGGIVWVDWTADACSDDLVSSLPSPFPTGALHGDAIANLPEAAIWLGFSSTYRHQAFKIGSSAWGVQFHPELSPTLYDDWVAAFIQTDPSLTALLRTGVEDFQRHGADIENATRALARRFAEIVVVHSRESRSAGNDR